MENCEENVVEILQDVSLVELDDSTLVEDGAADSTAEPKLDDTKEEEMLILEALGSENGDLFEESFEGEKSKAGGPMKCVIKIKKEEEKSISEDNKIDIKLVKLDKEVAIKSERDPKRIKTEGKIKTETKKEAGKIKTEIKKEAGKKQMIKMEDVKLEPKKVEDATKVVDDSLNISLDVSRSMYNKLKTILAKKPKEKQAKSAPEKAKDDYIELDAQEKAKVEKPKSSLHHYLWVSNMNPRTTASHLKLHFSKFGKVLKAKIVSNGSSYYGCAEMAKLTDVVACIDRLNGKELNGEALSLSQKPPTIVGKTVDNLKKGRHRSRSRDPLTLKVKPKKTSSRSRERERERIREREREAVAQLERERIRKRREVEEVLAMKNELAEEKRKLQLEKQDVQRMRELMEKRAIVEREKREFERRERERKQRSRSAPKRAQQQRWRSPSPKNKRSKRALTPPPAKRDKYRRDESRWAPPPPPAPRLTNDDMPRNKADPWKNDGKKHEYTRKHVANYPSNKYPRDEDKYKENKKRMEVVSRTFMPMVRSNEMFCGDPPARRFDNVSYPVQYGRQTAPSDYRCAPVEHIQEPTSSSSWSSNRQPYFNTSAPVMGKTMHPEPPPQRYDEYERRHDHYYPPNRKY